MPVFDSLSSAVLDSSFFKSKLLNELQSKLLPMTSMTAERMVDTHAAVTLCLALLLSVYKVFT